MSGRSTRDRGRRALEEARRADQRRRRRLRLAGWGGAVVILAGGGTGLGLGLSGGSSASTSPPGRYTALTTLGPLAADPAAGASGPESVPVPDVPVLAGAPARTTGPTVDGVACTTSEQTVLHIHTHLTIFVNGKQRQVPAGIGIPGAVTTQTSSGAYVEEGSCFYYLHTHAADGIIHIESPVQRTYTLGEFFDEWGQPLSSGQAGPARGKVTVLVNSRVFQGSPRDVPLGPHENLQLEVGAPLVEPETVSWAGTGL